MVNRFTIILIFSLCFTQAQAQNYEESKVAAYTLPHVLEMVDGTLVGNKTDWEKKRRPEIVRLFENEVYGQMPHVYDKLTFRVMNEDSRAMNGKAYLKEITITVTRASKSADIHLVLFTPHSSKKAMPVFLFINNRDKDNTDPTRTVKSEFWPAETMIANGFAAATFHVSDGAPDNKDTYQQGILQLYPEQIQADNGMRAIGAWAWTASRVLDYFQKDERVDAEKVYVVGHSRGGKAALWAGAQDQRFAMVFSNCSGNTGAALSRRKFGETIRIINTNFPHWFTPNYKKYNDNENALPIDQHMLIALQAPRPVYVTSATQDLWADPKGSYLSMLQAQPVYTLYKKFSGLSPSPPAINYPITMNSYLGYHNRSGIHNLTAYDWQNFIRFAQAHNKTKN